MSLHVLALSRLSNGRMSICPSISIPFRSLRSSQGCIRVLKVMEHLGQKVRTFRLLLQALEAVAVSCCSQPVYGSKWIKQMHKKLDMRTRKGSPSMNSNLVPTFYSICSTLPFMLDLDAGWASSRGKCG